MNADLNTIFDRALARTQDVHFWHSKVSIDTWPAAKLLALADACAQEFHVMGIRPGDRVAVCLPTSPEQLACILAAWGCAATLVLLPHSSRASNERAHSSKLSDALHLVTPHLIVHDEHIPYAAVAQVKHRVTRYRIAELAEQLRPDAPATALRFPTKPQPDDLALIQLTSGSTGLAKGVPLTHRQIAANCASIQQRVRMSDDDHIVSWLPTNHDMGLSAITVPIWINAPFTQIPSERFVRAPTTWLDAISHQRGTVSPNPAFAYTLLSKYAARLKPNEIDLSSWRYAWAGAEPVFDRHLRAFTEAFRRFGLRDTVLKPAFGMAEAVVAVTCDWPDRPYSTLHIDAALFRSTKQVKALPPGSPGTFAFVSNGPPLSNMAVKIVNDQGHDLGEAAEGRLMISGASVASAYLNGIDDHNFYPSGWFDTGDLGFLVDGELYVSGRVKDLIIRGGVNASPQQIEWAVEQFLELRPGQVAAFSVIDPVSAKEEIVVVVVKRRPADLVPELQAQLARVVVEQAGVQIDRLVLSGTAKLPKTTSGKVQRSLARQMYLNGEFNDAKVENR